jgi:hypothetical protein
MNHDTSAILIRELRNRSRAKLSEHLYLDEVTTCVYEGINNTPGTQARKNLKRIAVEIYEPLVECFGDSFFVFGGYRCRKYSGLSRTNHIKEYELGETIEFGVRQGLDLLNSEVFAHAFHWVPYHELIWCCPFPEIEPCTDPEPAWIRISLKKVHNKHIALREYWQDGRKLTKRVAR